MNYRLLLQYFLSTNSCIPYDCCVEFLKKFAIKEDVQFAQLVHEHKQDLPTACAAYKLGSFSFPALFCSVVNVKNRVVVLINGIDYWDSHYRSVLNLSNIIIKDCSEVKLAICRHDFEAMSVIDTCKFDCQHFVDTSLIDIGQNNFTLSSYNLGELNGSYIIIVQFDDPSCKILRTEIEVPVVATFTLHALTHHNSKPRFITSDISSDNSADQITNWLQSIKSYVTK